MNRAQANEIRVAHGLAPLPEVNKLAQKRRQAANHAARAQQNRDLRNSRTSKSKAK